VMSGHLCDRDRPFESGDDPGFQKFLTVVLAEDDEDLRSILATLLRKEGYRVFEVADGAGLLAGMTRASFDGIAIGDNVLLVTDARMPYTDGLSVVRTLQAQRRSPRFMLMTAFGEPELHAEAKRMGALAVFDKPFDFGDFRRAVGQVARRFALY
jgi:two-component system response regulator (stage 0 sporulation protein F)